MFSLLPDWPAFSVFPVATLAIGGHGPGMAHGQLVLRTAQRTSANSVLQ